MELLTLALAALVATGEKSRNFAYDKTRLTEREVSTPSSRMDQLHNRLTVSPFH
jgi:hypothetical protein